MYNTRNIVMVMVKESNRMNIMECDMAEVKTEIRNITKNQEESKIENNKAHDEIKLMIKDFVDSADDKYASKRVETVMWWIAGIIGSIIITAIMYLIIK
jgi:uncharacterized coiled-coil protein SlyX